MPVRLNRFLAAAGLGSRRAVEELIRAGRVSVNGVRGELGTRVEVGDYVRVDGVAVSAESRVHLLLNKPSGVVTTAHDPQGRPTVVELVAARARVYPVGRLDMDTTGLLLLTNDGDLAHRLMHPRHGVAKTYRVGVEGDPDAEAVLALRRGVELDDGRTAPADVRRLGPGALEVTIREGRNRQVRRMCEAVGHPVRSLHRLRYGPIELGDLPGGAWRELTAEEVEALRRA